jgi:hypothetical protein
MGKRKISILEPASTAVAEIAWFIENKGMPQTAKKFVDDAFLFFERLSDERVIHKPCSITDGKILNIVVFPTKENMLLRILASKKKLSFAILLLLNF